MRPFIPVSILAAAALAAGSALAQSPRPRPYAPKPPPPSVIPRHIPTPKPIATPPPRPNYSKQSMRLIQQNLATQQAAEARRRAEAAKASPYGEGPMAELMKAMLEGAPEPPPRLKPTPETLELARRVVRPELAVPLAGDVDADARMLTARAIMLQMKADAKPKDPLKADPTRAEIRQALAEAQAPLWASFVEDLAAVTAETYTAEELRALEAFVTSPQFASIMAKQQALSAPRNARAVILRQQRNAAALNALCRKHGEGSAYCAVAKAEQEAREAVAEAPAPAQAAGAAKDPF